MPLQIHHTDPGLLLERCFARIEVERMQDVPILNPALRVQTVQVEAWQGQWLATLVTPWFLNLVLLPGDAASWRSVRDGERVFHHFAAGDFAFLGSDEPELGEFQACSLISPMGQFCTQADAVETARAAMAVLHVQPQPQVDVASARAAPPPAAKAPARRVFLFGRA